MVSFSGKRRHILVVSAVVSVAGIVGGTTALYWKRSPMMLAPMIGLEPCFTPTNNSLKAQPQTREQLERMCSGPMGSAGALVESTLSALDDGTLFPQYELGYTLNFPLLKLFKKEGENWVIDRDLLRRTVRTIDHVDRPVVVYLFSTHFTQDAPIEKALAEEPSNLGWTQSGPLGTGKYYGADIFNWTFASTQNTLTQRRIEAANAVLGEICRLAPRNARKVRGITLLGELHHLFPDFEAGMGYAMPYLVTDYSDVSRRGFRQFVQQRMGSIEQFNATVGTRWTSFDQVEPPAKDIRTMPLRDYTDHIDSFAHGTLPVSGWAHVEGANAINPPTIHVYLNGEPVGRTPVSLHRQDVVAAMPQFGTTNTGWRLNLDFRSLPTGLHQVDVMIEKSPGDLVHLATRRIAIMDRSHSTPLPRPLKPLPPSRAADPTVKAHVDYPLEQASYFYNPLVPLWHEFRGRQVVDYLQHFNNAVSAPCLEQTQRYTHQIVPFTNPSWDENKFAIDASLEPLQQLRLGVSLYGEPTYGNSFLSWASQRQHTKYGITEFHPLKTLEPHAMATLFDQHARQGAQFLSFFMEPRWKGERISRHYNLFSLDPDNKDFGSAQLYRSVRAVITNHPGASNKNRPTTSAPKPLEITP